jgi:uncharacterized protein YndB with AHSA1/START domain
MKQAIIVKKERTIDFPVERVWQFIEPAENIAKWFPGAVYSERINGEARGRKQLMFVKWGKKEVEIIQEITEYDINKFIKWKYLREIVNGKEANPVSKETYFSIGLFPQGEKTRLILQSENIPGNGWKAILIKLIARPRIEKSISGALINIENAIRSPQFPKESLMDALL